MQAVVLPANVFFVTSLDNRPPNPSHDRTVPDLNDRLPNVAGGLPENSVYSCVTVDIRSSAASAHTASSGASGSGTHVSLYLCECHIAPSQYGGRGAVNKSTQFSELELDPTSCASHVRSESKAFVELPWPLAVSGSGLSSVRDFSQEQSRGFSRHVCRCPVLLRDGPT